jgi:hypothetical protein
VNDSKFETANLRFREFRLGKNLESIGILTSKCLKMRVDTSVWFFPNQSVQQMAAQSGLPPQALPLAPGNPPPSTH